MFRLVGTNLRNAVPFLGFGKGASFPKQLHIFTAFKCLVQDSGNTQTMEENCEPKLSGANC